MIFFLGVFIVFFRDEGRGLRLIVVGFRLRSIFFGYRNLVIFFLRNDFFLVMVVV